MRRPILIGALACSLALNLAVGATVGWHIWQERQTTAAVAQAKPSLSEQDLMRIREMCPKELHEKMMAARQEMFTKRARLLEEMARNAGDATNLETGINELFTLRNQMERQALTRIGFILQRLPQEKREAFVVFLKYRTCGSPVMGMGRQSRQGQAGCPMCGGLR